MTTTESKAPKREQDPELAAAAARASIRMYEYDHLPVPQWLRDVAAGKRLPRGFKQDPATGEQIAP